MIFLSLNVRGIGVDIKKVGLRGFVVKTKCSSLVSKNPCLVMLMNTSFKLFGVTRVLISSQKIQMENQEASLSYGTNIGSLGPFGTKMMASLRSRVFDYFVKYMGTFSPLFFL